MEAVSTVSRCNPFVQRYRQELYQAGIYSGPEKSEREFLISTACTRVHDSSCLVTSKRQIICCEVRVLLARFYVSPRRLLTVNSYHHLVLWYRTNYILRYCIIFRLSELFDIKVVCKLLRKYISFTFLVSIWSNWKICQRVFLEQLLRLTKKTCRE